MPTKNNAPVSVTEAEFQKAVVVSGFALTLACAISNKYRGRIFASQIAGLVLYGASHQSEPTKTFYNSNYSSHGGFFPRIATAYINGADRLLTAVGPQDPNKHSPNPEIDAAVVAATKAIEAVVKIFK